MSWQAEGELVVGTAWSRRHKGPQVLIPALILGDCNPGQVTLLHSSLSVKNRRLILVMLLSCEMQGLEEVVCVKSIQDVRAKCSYRVFCPKIALLCIITAGSVHAASQRLGLSFP